MRDAGYPEDQIQSWASNAAAQMAPHYSADQIRNYFGQKEPDLSDLKAHVKGNIDKISAAPETKEGEKTEASTAKLPDLTGKEQVEAKDVWDAMRAGWEGGDTGLFLNGLPKHVLPKDASLFQTFAAQTAQFVGDLPAMVAGAGALSELGPIGMAAGAFSAPAALRKILIDHYQKGDIKDASDFANRAVSTTWEAAKGAITGAATAATGGLFTGTAAKMAAEVLAMTTVSKGLEGELPDAKDFTNAAIAVGGLHAIGFGLGKSGGYIKEKLENIYAKTGVPPEQVVEAATKDPKLKGDLLSVNGDIPKEASGENNKPIEQLELPLEDKESPPPTDEDKAREDRILSVVKSTPKPEEPGFMGKIFDAVSKLWYKNFDYTESIRQMELRLQDETGKTFSKDESAYAATRFFNARMDKISQFISRATYDFKTGEANGEGYESILNDIKSKLGAAGIRTFNAYRIAKRSLNYEKRGFEAPGDLEDHRQFVKDHPEMQKFMDRYVAWRNRLLDYVGDSGRYSKDAISAMKKAGEDSFTPLKRVFESDPLTGKLPTSGSQIMRVVGSDRDIIDPFESDLKDLRAFITLALKTDAHNKFIKNFIYEDSPFIRKAEDQTKTIKIDSEARDLPIEGDLYTSVNKQRGMSQIEGWEDGKRTLYDVHPETAEALNGMAGNEPALNVFTGGMKYFASLLRLGTVQNPLFGIRHAWRQQITGATLSQTGLKLFQALSYAPEFLSGKSERYHKSVYDGALVSSIVPKMQDYVDGKIYEYDSKAPFLGKAWNAVKSLPEITHWAITQHDNIIRFAEYSRMLDKGASRAEAAFAAREVLPDFQKQGLQKAALDHLTAFFGVHLKGQARMFQALKGDFDNVKDLVTGNKDPIEALKELGTGYVVKNLAYITVPSVLLYMAQHDDDAIKDLPDWQKFAYWNIHISNWRPANSLAEAMSVKSAYPSNARQLPDGSWQVNDGTIVRLQKPFSNGIFFGSGFEAALESLKKEDPRQFEKFLKTVGGSLMAEPVPDSVKPMLEQYANRNFYTGQPIVRQSMENKVPEMQYDQYTSEVAKQLGKIIGYMPLVKDLGPSDAHMSSPKVIDNYIHSWTGTLGYYVVDALDKGLRAAGVAPPKVKPTDTLADIPFVKEFVVRFPNARPQSVADFEDRYKTSDQVRNSIRELLKEGDMMGAHQLSQKYSDNMERLKGIDTAIQRLNASIQKVNRLDTDPVQKRQLIDTMMYQMASMAKRGNELMDKFEKRAK